MDDLVAIIQQATGRRKVGDRLEKKPITSDVVALLEFDSDGALQRFGGNKEVYYRALVNFVADVDDQLKNLPVDIDGHLDLAKRILHTLKGLASTIGANAFARVADEHYQQLQTGCSFKQWNGIRVALEAEGHSAVVVANNLLKNRTLVKALPNTILPTSSQLPQDTLVELLQLLETSNMQALNIYDQLQEQYIGVPLPLLKQIGDAIERLDFIKAAVYCHMLLESEKKNE